MVGSRKQLAVQRRSFAHPGTSYVRASDPSIRTYWPAEDGKQGSMLNGPFWFLGRDDGLATMQDWEAYGYDGPFTPAGRSGVWGGSSSGYSGSVRFAGQRGVLPAVTRATELIVNPVIGTTWRYYRGTSTDLADIRQGQDEIPRPLWVADPQLLGSIPGGDGGRPTIPHPRRLGTHAYWKTALTHAVWFGIGAIMYAEDAFAQPLAGTMRIVNPVMWGWTEDGRLVLDPDGDNPLESDFDGYFAVGGYRWRVQLLRGFSPSDGATAEGALTRMPVTLEVGHRLNSYLAGVMSSGVPSGVLKVSVPNFDETDAADLKSSWMGAHGGERKSVAVLNSGVDFTPLQLSVVDADAVAARGSLLVDLAHAFNLSAASLDATTNSGGSLTYQNLNDARRAKLDDTLAPWGRGMEDLISSILPYGSLMRVDWSGYINTDPRQDLEFVAQGLAEGWLTIAEARDRLRLPPLDEAALVAGDPDAATVAAVPEGSAA